MGVRESQRREWRAAVARAAEAWRRVATCPQRGQFHRCRRPSRGMRFIFARCGHYGFEDVPVAAVAAWETLLTACSAPKPWTRPAAADLGKQVVRVQRRLGISDLSMEIELMTVLVRESARLELRRKRRAAQRRRK